MTLSVVEKAALGVSGLTALGIGAAILVAPHSFYASYGITVGNNPSLLSELRAPAAGLVAFGVLILAGIWRSKMAALAKAVALTVFLAFPAGRLVGLAIDGPPSGGIIGALSFELAVAALCVFAFIGRAGKVPGQLSAGRSGY